MILKYLRLRKRASKDASGNSTTPRTGSLDLVNRGDRPFVRTADNAEAGLLSETGTPVNSVARVEKLDVGGVCVDGTTFTIGNIGFQFNASDGTSVTNSTATPVKAQGTITITGAGPSNAEFFNVGSDADGGTMSYTFKTTPSTAKDIKIGASIAETCDNIVAAVNGTDGLYNTVENNQVTAANGTAGKVIFTAKYHGAAGDAVALAESAANTVVDGGGTLGGTTAGVDQKYVPINLTATAAKATGTLTFTGALTAGDQVRVGATTYTGVANSATAVAGQFQIGSGSAGAITNIIAAVNGTDGVNSANASATLAAGVGATIVATAIVGGVAGNSIVSTDPTDAASKMSWGASTLGSGDDSTQDESGTAIALAINGQSEFTSSYDASLNEVTVTHTLHGTAPNGWGYGEAVASAQVSVSADVWNTTIGVAGTEGVAGAQYEDDNFLYTCTSANATNKAYTWKKAPLYNINTNSGFSDSLVVSYKDFVTAGAGQVFTIPIPIGGIVTSVGYYLETAFNGGATSGLTLKIGDGSDDDGHMVASELHADATEVFYFSNATGEYHNVNAANEAVGKLYSAADTLDCTFTASGANINVHNSGKVIIYAQILRLNPNF